MRFEKRMVLSAPRDSVWRLLSQTDRLNRELGLPAVRFEFAPRDTGGTEITATMKIPGLTLRYREHAFEWEQPGSFQVKRTFLRGPIREIIAGTRLEADGEKTIVTGWLDIEPAGPAGSVIGTAIGRKSAADFGAACRHFEAYFLQRSPNPYPRQTAQPPANAERLAAARSRAVTAGSDARLAEMLAEYVSAAPPDAAMMIRPFVLADSWKADRTRVLETCLIAARIGLLDMHWRVLCPSCRGGPPAADRLSDLTGQVHCESCNIRFDTAFDQSVEVVFGAAPSIRPIEAATYCVGGPGLTPHIFAQWVIAPGTTREVGIETSGTFSLSSLQAMEAVPITIQAGGAQQFTVRLVTSGRRTQIEADSDSAAPSGLWTILNDTPHEVVLRLERPAWTADAATAAHVTSLQLFRDQFSSDVLAPGTELSVRQVCILFSDLKDSTARYRLYGDAPSYRAVREHFDWMRVLIAANRGAIVKTAGDAVMACFHDPADALAAAIAIQRGSPSAPSSFVIKLGLHWGPALVVTANERLDYFGQTVNLAARLQAASVGDDIVLTAETAEDPVTRRLVENSDLLCEPFEQPVRGLDTAVSMVRLRVAHHTAP